MIRIKTLLPVLIIFIFSVYINFLSAKVGVLPIDSFAFFDTGYLITKGFHPIKDIWISTGLLVDYMQALFFKILGVSWISYVLHASFLNFILSFFLFILFIKNQLNIYLSLFYALSVSILFYPTIGTPFAYHHALLFSIISVMILYLIIKFNYKSFWFCLPISMLVSFLCMQTPSAYINILILSYLVFHFLKKKDFNSYKYFLFGSLFCLIGLSIYFIITKVSLKSFVYQYILFPLTIGADRITSSDGAYVSLNSKITFKSILGHFKFIHFVLLILIYETIKNFKNNKLKYFSKNLEIFLLVFISTLIFIFNQLVTANQIYIFCLIPILAALTNIMLVENKSKNILIKSIFLVLIVGISTTKYFERFNIDRKFIDLENINLKNSIEGNLIDSKFEHLKWISMNYANNPELEIKNIKFVIKKLKGDNRKKMVITHYQFFSALLDENLNNLNRWYTHDNNSYPLEKHKYFYFYKDFINSKLSNKKIEVIYLIDSGGKGNLKISNFKKYLNDVCFSSQFIVKDFFSSHSITKCK